MLMTSTRNRATSSARVYLDYDQESIPPHPGSNWTRFVCISDTHSRVFSIPAGDVLLHAGDLSSWGHPHQLHTTLLWLKSQKHPIKMFWLSTELNLRRMLTLAPRIIAGNHDVSNALNYNTAAVDIVRFSCAWTQTFSEMSNWSRYVRIHSNISFISPADFTRRKLNNLMRYGRLWRAMPCVRPTYTTWSMNLSLSWHQLVEHGTSMVLQYVKLRWNLPVRQNASVFSRPLENTLGEPSNILRRTKLQVHPFHRDFLQLITRYCCTISDLPEDPIRHWDSSDPHASLHDSWPDETWKECWVSTTCRKACDAGDLPIACVRVSGHSSTSELGLSVFFEKTYSWGAWGRHNHGGRCRAGGRQRCSCPFGFSGSSCGLAKLSLLISAVGQLCSQVSFVTKACREQSYNQVQ